ncbi:SRPBCC family protein [Alkalinema sp. FACHB-956]|uniref:SRPBCC family protein n=1 Tax=Alkalinema sp. FACHB-956 TaxID=2692768 RepID=UPI00168A35FB|nr:SRPBCC family protein [Alkalinema sp. FACHB-956]MBD2329310.1 SRPBCC family protein [Alkalinema sp. FACHB-956]
MFLAVGVGLTVFAVDLLHQSTGRRMATWRALYASGADFLWVLGSVMLLGLFPDVLSRSGQIWVMAVAGVVLMLGLWQVWAIAKAHQVQGKAQYRHCILVETNAPADVMWQVVSRLGAIKNYMPSLKNSVILDGRSPGIGAVRMCEDHTGKRWSEQCTEFNDGRGFKVRFLSEEPDFPFPAKTMQGGWEVFPTRHGSQVRVWWELVPKQKWLTPIVLPLLAFQADRDFPTIIQRMASDALEQSPTLVPQARGYAIARLLQQFC